MAILERGKSRSRAWFSENRKASRMLASDSRDSAMRLQWRVEDLGVPSASRSFDLRAYVPELVKRIRLSVESHPRSLRLRLSRERMRFEESSNGLMVYTSWRCALVKTRKSSRGRSTPWELASGQGDTPQRCQFTTSWKAIRRSLGARLIFLALLRCAPRCR